MPKSFSPVVSVLSTLKSRKTLLILVLAAIWYFHYRYLHVLAEGDKHFSHLSALERELSFRSEMAMYYSYFKDLINAQSLSSAWNSLTNDQLTQYPDTINALQRFNIYPEIIVAIAYRCFIFVAEILNIPVLECWQVDRGSLPTVTSCDGLGEPAFFYVNFIFLLNGLLPVILFLFGYFLSGNSIVGGTLAASTFFFNHRESTRVMWTPPLRESFAFPFFILQNLIVESCLKSRVFNMKIFWLLTSCNVILLLFWQFSQFAFLTQLLALSFMYGARLFDDSSFPALFCIIKSHVCSIVIAAVLLLGNRFLLTSLYAAALINFFFVLAGHQNTKDLSFPVAFLFRCSLMMAGTFSIRHVLISIVGVEDDSHILDLLKTKLTAFRSFHSQLYICAPEFDFIGYNGVYSLTSTLLLPLVALLAIQSLISGKLMQLHLAYHFLQLCAYATMAIFIMRLKLFFTPFLCITTSLLGTWKDNSVQRKSQANNNDKNNHNSNNADSGNKKHRFIRWLVVTIVFGAMCVPGSGNIRSELEFSSEFSNWPLESMIKWIRSNTSPNDAFAGAMPTTAAIRLTSARPIANHPHYEDATIRNRTFDVYTVYSRKSLASIHSIYKKLGIRYAVVEDIWCESQRGGCALAELYDLVDVDNRNKEPACFRMLKGNAEPYFKLVFRKEPYSLLEVNRSL